MIQKLLVKLLVVLLLTVAVLQGITIKTYCGLTVIANGVERELAPGVEAQLNVTLPAQMAFIFNCSNVTGFVEGRLDLDKFIVTRLNLTGIPAASVKIADVKFLTREAVFSIAGLPPNTPVYAYVDNRGLNVVYKNGTYEFAVPVSASSSFVNVTASNLLSFKAVLTPTGDVVIQHIERPPVPVRITSVVRLVERTVSIEIKPFELSSATEISRRIGLDVLVTPLYEVYRFVEVVVLGESGPVNASLRILANNTVIGEAVVNGTAWVQVPNSTVILEAVAEGYKPARKVLKPGPNLERVEIRLQRPNIVDNLVAALENLAGFIRHHLDVFLTLMIILIIIIAVLVIVKE